MDPLTLTERRIAGLGELSNVVSAVRSLSAARLQDARQTLTGATQYAATVDRALAAAVPLLGVSPGPSLLSHAGTAVVLFGPEHGFVGALAHCGVDAAIAAAQARPNSRLLVIGSRSARTTQEAGAQVTWMETMATRAAGVGEVARRTADCIGRGIATNEFDMVVLVFAQSAAGASPGIQTQVLLPFDPTPYRLAEAAATPPLHYLPPDLLIEKLVEELIFSRLMRAALESFASEHQARLATMHHAHHSIEERLQLLVRQARRQRQEKVTTELLDIVAGATSFAEAEVAAS
jgi:F-type H+-transporting ATPase subunit gamma